MFSITYKITPANLLFLLDNLFSSFFTFNNQNVIPLLKEIENARVYITTREQPRVALIAATQPKRERQEQKENTTGTG
jgi:hypothetical protein